jgi:hypothetical protein
MIARAEAAEAR